jgi:hypothetical protein
MHHITRIGYDDAPRRGRYGSSLAVYDVEQARNGAEDDGAIRTCRYGSVFERLEEIEVRIGTFGDVEIV